MTISYYDQEVIEGEKSIFLAGPTPRTPGIISWRKEACEILEELGFNGIVYVPEYSDGETRNNYNYEAMWERKALTLSTVIIFWIPRSLPYMAGFSTNVEFGYWLHTKKVIYGRPDNAVKIRYLDWLYKTDYGLNPINNLNELLQKATEMVNDIKVCRE
jgi:hypothetical protein